MPLFITSLNSGSNGNCYYVGNEKEAVLIDAGISCRETEKRMKRLGLYMSHVKAIFVSHEHTDHITGIPVLSKKYQLPVYITTATLRSSNLPIEKHLVYHFQTGKTITVGNLNIKSFFKSHDAADPHSFVVSCEGIKVGVFTDIGISCKEVTKHFSKCHAAFLESNYCDEMLANGDYPYHLKKRISSDKGHLSNAQALQLFLEHRGEQLSHIVLSHLSKNNNSAALVNGLFTENAGHIKVIVASRYEETPVFCIENRNCEAKRPSNEILTFTQLSLF
jgi:phosphoribosyl 1,2-cyclic phosphodiesterase